MILMKNWWDIVNRRNMSGKPVLEPRPTTIYIFYCRKIGYLTTCCNHVIIIWVPLDVKDVLLVCCDLWNVHVHQTCEKKRNWIKNDKNIENPWIFRADDLRSLVGNSPPMSYNRTKFRGQNFRHQFEISAVFSAEKNWWVSLFLGEQSFSALLSVAS